jgi:GntR family transcriptional regulator
LYLHIKEDIEAKVRMDILKPGTKLPSEPELAKGYQVSRPTLREALKMLQKERIIISLNGVGTFINDRRAAIENPLNQLKSLGEMIRSAGFQESETDVKVYEQHPVTEWAEKLQTSDQVMVIERTRIADQIKVAFYYNIIPATIAGDNIKAFRDSIFDFLENQAGIRISHCLTELVALNNADPFDNKATMVLGDQVVKLKQLHFDTHNQPVLYSIDYLKSDVIKLMVYRER